MIRSWLFLLLFAVLLADASATSHSFRFFPWGASIQALYIRQGDRYEPLPVTTEQLSRLYRYHEGEPIYLYKRSDGAETSGLHSTASSGRNEVVYSVVCEIAVPSAGADGIVFVRNASDGTVKGAFTPFNFQTAREKSFTLFNLTSETLRVDLGKTGIELLPGQNRTCWESDFTLAEGDTLRCRIFNLKNGQQQLVYSRTASFVHNGRVLLFAYKSEDNGIRVKVVRDFLVNDATRESLDRTDWTDAGVAGFESR